MIPIHALFFIAVSACCVSACAPKHPEFSGTAPALSTPDCPSALDMEQPHLQGVWRAQGGAVLHLHPHPELSGSVRGTVQRAGTTAQVTGDVHQGTLTLEESTDGVHISATWLGDVVEGSCGKEIHGLWNTPTPETTTPFVLRKQTP